MKRIRWMLCGSLLLLLSVTAGMAQDTSAPEFRSLHITAWSSGFESDAATTTMVNYATAGNLNVIIPEVRLRADAYYTSTIEPPGTGIIATPVGYDSLADCLAKAHPLGIEVHPWVVTYRIWTNTTGPGHTTPEHLWWTHGPGNTDPTQDWLMYSDTGAWDYNGTVNLDPGIPAVEDYLVSVFLDIVTRYNVDGLSLDYIRYPSINYGYNPVSIQRFNTEYGRSGNPPPTDTTWQNWRRDQVTNLVKRLYLEIKAVKPQVELGASVWNYWSTGYSTYLQDWDSWMRNHWIDYVQPMTYSSNNTTFSGWLDDAVNRQYGRYVYPLVDTSLNISSNVLPQIDLVRQHGFSGLGLYAYNSIPDRSALQSALVSGPFPTSLTPADMPWLTAPTLGMLKGRILDSSGNAIYPATITVQSQTTKNTGTGFYGFVDLATGDYTVSVSAPGYQSNNGQVTINAGLVTTLDLTLTPDVTIPLAPSELVATPVSTSEINLIWVDKALNEQGFTIEQCTGEGCNDFVQIDTVPANTTSYASNGLAASTSYSYRVRAFNAAGDSAYSNTATTSTLSAGFIDQVPSSESAVSGTVSGTYLNTQGNDGNYQSILEVESGGMVTKRYSYLEHKWLVSVQPGGTVTLYANTWAPLSTDGDTFIFAYSTDNVNYVNMFTLTGTSDDNNYKSYQLPAGTTGTVYVRVRDTDRTAGHRTLDIVFIDHLYIRSTGMPTEPPSAPVGLTATAISASQINLSWTDTAADELGFEIERSLSETTGFGLIGTVAADTTSYSDTGLSSGTTYYYRVRAFNSIGDSDYSNVASATTLATPPVPNAPTNLVATAISKSQINLAWTDNASNEDGFYIERCQGSTCTNFVRIATVGANVTTFVNTGLSRGTTYRYRVAAFNAGGESAYSNIATATTLRR